MEIILESKKKVRKKTKCPTMVKNAIETFFGNAELTNKIDWTSIQLKKNRNGTLDLFYTENK